MLLLPVVDDLHLLVRSIMELIKSFTFVGIPNLFDMLIAVI